MKLMMARAFASARERWPTKTAPHATSSQPDAMSCALASRHAARQAPTPAYFEACALASRAW